MVAKSFAELEFRCPDFLEALDTWAAGAEIRKLEPCLDLLQSLAAFAALEGSLRWPSPKPFGQLAPSLAPVAVRELAGLLGRRVKELEPSQLHTAALAMGKLRVQDSIGNVGMFKPKTEIAKYGACLVGLCFQGLGVRRASAPQFSRTWWSWRPSRERSWQT